MGAFIAGIILCWVVWYTICALIYRTTDYYKTTHKLYISVIRDKGNYGEYLTYKKLRSYMLDGAKFLYNCYLPKEDGETTEIDVMMIHTSGVYVFESKNYSGWIFGSENQKTWTQSLASGRRSKKFHFLNPIMQNKLHIKWLKAQIGEEPLVHSIIVFSERCTLKKVKVTSKDITVVKRNNLKAAVLKKSMQSRNALTQEQVNEIYAKLYPFTQVSDAVKEKHIQDIKAEHGMAIPVVEEPVIEEPVAVEAQEIGTPEVEQPVVEEETQKEQIVSTEPEVEKPSEMVCPRCGNQLVLRTSKRGENAGNQFYGCSNYPKCRYIQNL